MDGGSMIGAIRALAHIAVPLVAFAVGLSAASSEVTWLWRRPALLARSLLAVLVLVPLAAVLLVKAVPLPPGVGAGLLVMAIAIGPVAGLKRARAGGGHESYALGLNLTLLLISIPFVPLAAAAEAAAFGSKVDIDMASVAKVVVPLQLVPLALGIVVARLWPGFALRIAKPASLIGNVAMGVLGVVLIIALAKPMLGLGMRGLLASVALAAIAVAIGHLLGGPEGRSRFALASFSALRFPALGILLATKTRAPREVIPEVLAYILVSIVVVGLYGLLLRGLAGRRQERQAPLTPAPSGAR
jgi:BASS family bile acid:Na+ symporter